MSLSEHPPLTPSAIFADEEMREAASDRTREILDRRRRTATVHRRGWLVRRALLSADVLGLALAFFIAELVVGTGDEIGVVWRQIAYFVVTLPAWVIVAKIYGLYEKDEERTDHSTADDLAGVFHLVTIGAWLFFMLAWLTKFTGPNITKLAIFWALALGLVATGRIIARAMCRHSIAFIQNAVIVGAGEVGQLIARKILQHPEYGINIVGFVDIDPKERRADVAHLAMLGAPEQLPTVVRLLDVERVIVAFSNESHVQSLELIRSLKDLNVQVDIVPRLFEIVGPTVGVHSVEGLPLFGLAPVKISRSSQAIKRLVDVVGSLFGLLALAPLFVYIAWRIRRDSPGPVFFRQTRLGMNMREFTTLKFRTMKVDTKDDEHRDFIKAIRSASALPQANGLYKLERDDAITPFGRWLRRTSLDELPQLINVLRGDMSLVGPRPCIPYETETFEPHHFERFLVPAGITGLWQVMARAHATFGEALDLDVAYARGWSLGLDLRLLFRTPAQLLGVRGTR